MKKVFLIFLVLTLILVGGCNAADKPDDSADREKIHFSPESSEYYDDVKAILDAEGDKGLIKPFVSADEYGFDYEGNCFHSSGKAVVYLSSSLGYPYAALSAEQNANPFAAINSFVNKGLIKAEENVDTNKVQFKYSFSEGADFELKMLDNKSPKTSFAHSSDGCKELLNKILSYTSMNAESSVYFKPVTENLPIAYSEEDNCYYGYAVSYNTSTAYMLGFYFKSDDLKNITDVEFQLLDLRYPCGDFSAGVSLSIGMSRESIAFDVNSLMTAIELSLTGESYFQNNGIDSNLVNKDFFIPNEYTLGEYTSTLSKALYVKDSGITDAEAESFTLYTYSIGK